MGRSSNPRISEELARVIKDKTEEYNKRNPFDTPISQVEVSRLIAEYLATVPAESLVKRYERCKPNGNRFNIRLVGNFPGAGLSL